MASGGKSDKYSIGNSRSPMMFRKRKDKDKNLCRSLDNLLISSFDKDEEAASCPVEWPELASVRKVGPVVMCILPPFSADLVCSALLSVGATPLVTADELDVVKDLRNSKAVVVDISAPTHLISALMDCFDPTSDVCLVLAATQVGANDRKRDLAVELIDRCGPSLVTGRLADIYALGQVVVEKALSSASDDEEDDKFAHPQISIDRTPETQPKSSSPAPTSSRKQNRYQRRSPARDDLSPRSSPRASPQSSPLHSLVGSSPKGHSPRSSPAGVRRGIKVGRKIGRTNTIHPRVYMKGQFQDDSMLEVNVDDALLYGQKLAAYCRASIYLYETSVLTDGETDIEILNPQPGTKYLHSLLPCSAAIAAACVSSVLRETEDNEDILLHQYSHAMALWCVAIEEASNHANQKGRVLPGHMRHALIDALHYLREPHVRTTARISLYCMRIGKPN